MRTFVGTRIFFLHRGQEVIVSPLGVSGVSGVSGGFGSALRGAPNSVTVPQSAQRTRSDKPGGTCKVVPQLEHRCSAQGGTDCSEDRPPALKPNLCVVTTGGGEGRARDWGWV